ncbi:hypothetical protein [Demequina silvatica]|uniref:hypothetical protein n=1 Tax=Demequina silvatica TaxID=1638988 RepID=UPI000783DDB3|nr:hypothetical protein [Demequina silvatica]
MKLSDALRGAADRAPLDGLAVDTGRAARRAATQRGLRTGATGVLAGGMVVVVGFGVSGVTGAGTFSSADDAGAEESAAVAEDSAGDARGDGEMAAGGGAAASSIAWGLCGDTLPDLSDVRAPVSLATALDESVVAGADAPAELTGTVTATVLVPGAYEGFSTDVVVLWDGIVVGVGSADGLPGGAVSSEGPVAIDLVEGEQPATAVSVPVVNCWDGEPLPAGEYSVVSSVELWQAPEVAEDGSAVASSAGARAVSEPAAFTVTGDAVDDPFGAYLGTTDPPTDPTIEPDEPVEPKPDGTPSDAKPTVNPAALDTDTARDLYRDGLAGAWDMAAGTQRWLVSGDSTGDLRSGWFGCAWEGDGAFPSRSSAMGLMDVAVDAPASIDVSYGWVVDGNPAVSSRVTNASAWDLDEFWDAGSLQLALVRDGRVVAEAYPVDPHLQGVVAYGGVAEPAIAEDKAAEGAAGAAEMTIAPYPYPEGGLERGATVSTELLWRDVNGCWDNAGQAEVEPGTYTLLAMHYLTVGGDVMWTGDGAEGTEGSSGSLGDLRGTLDDATDGPSLVAPETGTLGGGTSREGELGEATAGGSDAAMPPADGAYDMVDFQVWTSLGTITVR